MELSDRKPNAWFWERARQRARESQETESDDVSGSSNTDPTPGSLTEARKNLKYMRYRYPDGEGQERVGSLMELLGEVEGLAMGE